MKIPHVTVEFDEEETDTLGKMSPALVSGFSVHWAWTFIMVFSATTQPHIGVPGASSAFVSSAFVISSVASILTLFSYGFFLERIRKLFATPRMRARNRLIAATLASLGTLLAIIATFGVPGSIAFSAVGAALMGVGSAILLMSYGVSFSICDLPAAAACTAISLGCAAAGYICLLALGMVSMAFVALFVVVAPFIECACLKTASRQLVDNFEFSQFTIPVKKAPFAIHVIFPGIVLGFVLELVRLHAFSVVATIPFGEIAAPSLCAALVCFLLILFAIYTQRHIHNFIFRTMMPVVAVLLAFVAFTEASVPWWSIFSLFTSCLLLEACLWVLLSDISQRFRISAFTVFGFGRSAQSFGALLAFTPVMSSDAVLYLGNWQLFACVALVGIVFGTALLPRTSELRNALKIGHGCPALLTDEEILKDEIDLDLRERLAPSATRNGAAPSAPVVAATPAGAGLSSTPATARDASAPAFAATPGDRSADRSHASAAATRGPEVPTGASPLVDSSSEAPATASPLVGPSSGAALAGASATGTTAAADGSSPAGTTAAAGASAMAGSPSAAGGAAAAGTASTGGATAAAADAASAARKREADTAIAESVAEAAMANMTAEQMAKAKQGRFKRKCAAVANTYLLSMKETEVLYLLAKGYNSAMIQECLYIAAGTVNTHMRHIYRKLDIHSQQEFINLVESTEVEDVDF